MTGRAAVRYDDTARALVLSFKYSDRLDLAPMMGCWMARAGASHVDVLVFARVVAPLRSPI